MFRENPDFISIFIVSRYQLIETPTPTNSLNVAYVVIGRYEEGAGYMPMPLGKKRDFRNPRPERRIANRQHRPLHSVCLPQGADRLAEG